MSDIDNELYKIRKAKPRVWLILAIVLLGVGVSNLANKNSGAGMSVLLIVLGAYFGWKCWADIKYLKSAPAELVSQVRDERQGQAKAKATKSAVRIKYQAGMDDLSLRGSYNLFATDKALVLAQGAKRIEFSWKEVESVEAGTEDELRSRLTLTRVAAIGIFALGAKKEKKQDFFVTITTNNGVGLFDLVASGKNKAVLSKAKAFSVSCNSKIRTMKSKS